MKETDYIPSVALTDIVLPFQLNSGQVRGRLIKLGPALDLILKQHAYPPPVCAILGKAVVLAAALASALKSKGMLTLQAKTNGALKLLVADITSTGGVRAYAQFDETLPADPAANLLGEGYLAFTIDQSGANRYQGIVRLEGEDIVAAVHHYFKQSEQIPTAMVAHCAPDENGHWSAGCLFVQKMPNEGGAQVANDTGMQNEWDNANILMQTLTLEELISSSLAPEELLYRLFHEDGVRVFEKFGLRHECRCGLEKVENLLRSLPPEEIEAMAVNGLVTMTCEFCNQDYQFDSEQRTALYTNAPKADAGTGSNTAAKTTPNEKRENAETVLVQKTETDQPPPKTIH